VSLSVAALGLGALLIVGRFCSAEPWRVDVGETDTPNPLEQRLAEDPWAVADEQRLAAIEAWEDGDAYMAVVHAHTATRAAGKAIPQEVLDWRRGREERSPTESLDIWESAEVKAALAELSAMADNNTQHLRPDDPDANYDTADPAWHDTRAAQRATIAAWEAIATHREERVGTDAEQTWAAAAGAWLDAMLAWDYAYDLVDQRHKSALKAWWDSK